MVFSNAVSRMPSAKINPDSIPSDGHSRSQSIAESKGAGTVGSLDSPCVQDGETGNAFEQTKTSKIDESFGGIQLTKR